jgi:hypothetical protein
VVVPAFAAPMIRNVGKFAMIFESFCIKLYETSLKSW